MLSSTCFEPEGSSSGRRLFVQVWYTVCFTCICISSLVCRRVCSVQNTLEHPSYTPYCSHRCMLNTPHCINNPLPEFEPTRFETFRRQQKLNINLEIWEFLWCCITAWKYIINVVYLLLVSGNSCGYLQGNALHRIDLTEYCRSFWNITQIYNTSYLRIGSKHSLVQRI